MGSIAYTATRSLDAGVSLNDPITRDVEFREANYRFTVAGAREVALAGNEENVFERITEFFDVVTAYHLPAELPELLQFFHSVANGEQFDIDFTGTIASPDTVRTVVMEGRAGAEVKLGDGANAPTRWSFTVKVV